MLLNERMLFWMLQLSALKYVKFKLTSTWCRMRPAQIQRWPILFGTHQDDDPIALIAGKTHFCFRQRAVDAHGLKHMRIGRAEFLRLQEGKLLRLKAFVQRIVPSHPCCEDADQARLALGADGHLRVPRTGYSLGGPQKSAGQTLGRKDHRSVDRLSLDFGGFWRRRGRNAARYPKPKG